MRRLALLLMALCLAATAGADNFGSAVTSASSFTLIRGARPAAMGGAYIAVADDALSILYNPAGLTELRETELSASHMEWLDGVRDESLSLGVPLFGLGAWGLGATYLYANDDGYDAFGQPTGSFQDFDFSAQAAFALQLGDNASVGAVYKILREGYASNFDMGSAFDAGFNYKGFFERHLALALTADNMGGNMALGTGFGPLPLTLKAGLALHLGDRLLGAADYEYQPYDYVSNYHLGAEYSFPLADDSDAAFRAGYLIGPSNEQGGLSGLSAGLGAHWHAWRVDYAYVPKGDLGLSQLVTLSVGFGQH
jgi:hypothetical protein